jgi:putative ABC transport system permease protein
MFRTALSTVLAHKARLLMTVLAVMLGVSFVSGTLVFTDTLGNAFKKSSAQSFDNVSVAIQPTGSDPGSDPGSGSAGGGRGSGSGSGSLGQKLLDAVNGLPGTGSATGTVSGFTAVADKKGKLIGDGWSTRGANYAGTAKYPLAKGRAPSTSSEVAIDTRPPSAPATRSGTPYGCP